MATTLNDIFGSHARALILRGKRAEILANNLANADTPGFKARDFDFAKAMDNATRTHLPGQMTATNAKHINQQHNDLNGFMDLKFRGSTGERMDGNNVDAQKETSEFTENALRYQATLTFLNGRIRSIMTAIKGD